jgi:Emfourin
VAEIEVERIGGFAGFGGTSRLRSRGVVRSEELSAADREALDTLFGNRGGGGDNAARDGFAYRLTRKGPDGMQSVTVDEAHVPAAVASSVRDTLD